MPVIAQYLLISHGSKISKTFGCIRHELMIAYLNAYGFALLAVKLISSDLANLKQRTKLHFSFTSYADIIYRLYQGFIMEPVLFNIFAVDLFLRTNDINFASCADDNTICFMNDCVYDVIALLIDSARLSSIVSATPNEGKH